MILKIKEPILLIFFFLLFTLGLVNCKKTEEKKSFLQKYDTRDLLGTWKIVPSEGKKIVFEPEGKIRIILSNGVSEEIFAMSDQSGIRFTRGENDRNPFGYFLFSEKRKNVWSGYWEDEIVRLEKEVTKKKSVLE